MRAHLLILAAIVLPLIARAEKVSTGQTAKEIEDLGVIEAVEGGEVEKSRMRVSVGTRAEFNTNAKLTGHHGSGDLIFFPQIEVGFNTPLRNNFSFDIAAKVDSGIYVDNGERSYIGYSIISTLDWRPRLNWPRIYIGAEPYRYDSFDVGERITQAIGLTAGTDWAVGFNHGYSMFFVGYSFSDYLADPTIDNRLMHKAIVGITHQFSDKLFGTLFYQFAFSDYQNVDRQDQRHILGGNLSYQFSKAVFGSFSSSFVDNESTQDFGSYQALSLALGVNVLF